MQRIDIGLGGERDINNDYSRIVPGTPYGVTHAPPALFSARVSISAVNCRLFSSGLIKAARQPLHVHLLGYFGENGSETKWGITAAIFLHQITSFPRVKNIWRCKYS